MRLSQPRVQPLDPETADGLAKEQLQRAAERGPVLNITRTLANYPELSRAWGSSPATSWPAPPSPRASAS